MRTDRGCFVRCVRMIQMVWASSYLFTKLVFFTSRSVMSPNAPPTKVTIILCHSKTTHTPMALCRTCKQLAFLLLPCVGHTEIQFSGLLVSNPSCRLGGLSHSDPPRNKIWPLRTHQGLCDWSARGGQKEFDVIHYMTEWTPKTHCLMESLQSLEIK